jgi:hypothetical protein
MPVYDDRSIMGFTQRGVTTTSRAADLSQVPLRINSYGEQHQVPLGLGRSNLCDEGSYYVATTTISAGATVPVAGIAAASSFSDLQSLVYLENINTAASKKYIYLDYLKLLLTTAGTNGTNLHYAAKVDASGRYTSGGTTITPVNLTEWQTGKSNSNCYFGALVTTAAGSGARLVGTGLLRTVIGVVGDTYTWDFGGDMVDTSALAIGGTAVTNVNTRCAPVILGPNTSFVFNTWASSQSAAISWEIELGYWER